MKFWTRHAAVFLLRVSCLTLLVVPVWLPSGWAEEDSLTLEQALDAAIRCNPEILAAQARLGVSEAKILTAGARPNPELMTDNGVAERTYRLGIVQTLELGGKRGRRIALARQERETVLAEIQTVVLDLRAEVRRTYTKLYNLQQRQASYQTLLDTSERLLDISKRREQAGDIAQVDVLQARMVMLNARNDFETIRYQVTQAQNAMNLLLNRPIGAPMSLLAPNTFPAGVAMQIPTASDQPASLSGNVSLMDMNPDKLAAVAMTLRPEVRQNLAEQTLAERELALAKANRVPDLNLAAGNDLVTGEGGGHSVFVMGNLELPLLNRQQGPIQEALARQVELQRQQALLKNQVAMEISDAYNDFVLNRDRIHRYETEILPTALEVMEKSYRSFEVGKSPIFVPLNAQQTYQAIQLGYQQALLDYQNAISDLERAIGSGL